MPEPTAEPQEFSAIIAAYLQASEAGADDDPKEWVARHPEFAAELEEFFQDHLQLGQLAKPASDSGANDTQSLRRRPYAGTGEETPTRVIGKLLEDGAERDPLPRRFGDYELLEVIARGGMGIVYKARQVSANRLVALKMLVSGPNATAEDLQRFRIEAEAAANLDHPNIVPVYEVGVEAGVHYFSMKRIEGGSLSQHVSHFQQNLGEAAALMAQVSRAVHYAHERGILHRDLKPGNILLGTRKQELGARKDNVHSKSSLAPSSWLLDPVPYVTDFGLAKRLEVDSQLTQSGAIVGTPSYMAPEQAGGKKELTSAADVFSQGAILYHILTGQRPFQGETPMAVLLQVQMHDPERPSRVNDKVDSDLEVICLKCLEKDPGRRYPSAEALAEDLERWRNGRPIMARRVSRLRRTWLWARSRPAVAGLSVAFLLLFFTSIGVGTWMWQKMQPPNPPAPEPVADFDAYVNGIEEAQRKLKQGEPDAEATLDRCSPDLRGWEWYYLKRVCRGLQAETLVPLHAEEFKFEGDLSRDAKLLVGFTAGNVTVWDIAAAHGTVVAKWNPGVDTGTARFSPDGKRLAIGDRVNITLLTLPDKKVTLATQQGNVKLAFSPDGKHLVSAGSNRWVRIRDSFTGKVIHELGTTKDVSRNVAYSPDGKFIAAANIKSLGVWDAASRAAPGAAPLLNLHDSGDYQWAAFKPDSTQLAVASHDKSVLVWSTSTWTSLPRLVGNDTGGACFRVAYCDRTSRLVATGEGELIVWNPDFKRPVFSLQRKGPTFASWLAFRAGKIAIDTTAGILVLDGSPFSD